MYEAERAACARSLVEVCDVLRCPHTKEVQKLKDRKERPRRKDDEGLLGA